MSTTRSNDTNNIALANPFIYKGYYYDVETGLVMVGQRYYSPELCRFIQPANVSSLNPHSINGLNLYAYANNNPIGITYSGSNIGVSGLSNGGKVGSISEPLNINDSTERNKKHCVIHRSDWFYGFYKGIPMVKNPFSSERSGSFGLMFIVENQNQDIDILNHEWRHTRQLALLGMKDYFLMIGIPSLLSGNVGAEDYYRLPWEVTADYFGGVHRPTTTNNDVAIGFAYLATAKMNSNLFVKPTLTSILPILDVIVPGLGTTLVILLWL